MRLKSLKLAGFKSFANPTTFTFKHGITAIVGPNGCGKSNVIDAIRWVLGETSAKQLRGGAMSDVIFAGVEGRAAKSLASVELVFEHTQDEAHGIRHELNLYQELSLRRQVTKEGKSDYFINGQRVRRRDVVDVFLGTGLGARSYAVIEQGMIGRIVESSPMQLREFIEEGAGVSRYQARRIETEKKLNDTRDNLERLSDLQGELKKQHKTLLRQAESAKTYQALDEKLAKLKQDDLMRRLFESWRYHELKKSEQTSGQAGLSVLEADVTRVRRELDELSARVAEGQWLKDDARDKYHNAQMAEQAAQHSFYTVNSELAQNDEKITRLTQAQAEATANITHATNELSQISTELNAISPDVHVGAEKLDKLKVDLQTAQTAWQAQRDIVNSLTNKKHSLENAEKLGQMQLARIISAQEKWQKKQDALHAAAAKLSATDDMTAKLKTLNDEINTLTLRLDGLDESETKAKFDHFSELNKTLALSLTALEKKHASLASEYDILHKLVHAKPTAAKQGNGTDALVNKPMLKDSIRLTGLGENYTDTLDKFLGLWLDAHIADGAIDGELFAQTKGAVLALGDKAPLPEALTKHAITKHLIAVQDLIEAPKLGLFAQCFLIKTSGLDCIDTLSSTDLAGVLLITETGWLIGGFGAMHISWFGEMGGQFLAERAAHMTRLSQLEDQLNSIEDEMDAAQKTLKTTAAQLEGAKITLEETRAQRTAVTASLHATERAKIQLDADIAAATKEAQNSAKAQALLDEEKAELAKELADVTAERDQAKAALGDFVPELEAANQAMTVLAAAIDDKSQIVKAHSDSFQTLQVKHSTLTQAKAHAERLLEMAKAAAQQTASDIALTESATHKLGARLPELEAMFKKAKADSAAAKIVSDEYEAAAKALQLGQSKLQDALAEAHAKFATEQAKLAQISTDTAVGESRMQDIADLLLQANDKFNLAATLADFRANPEQRFIDNSEEQAEVAAKIARLGAVNLAAAEELAELELRVSPMDTQINDITESMEKLQDAIRAIDEKTKTLFLNALDAVNKELNTLFSKVFGGGQASLTLIDDENLHKADKWRAGLTLMAQPKGKKNSRLAVLSGGEKTLTALSLIFAIFKQHPAPFCVLDEVDAPLDDANVGRFTGLIQELANDVQFIFISHNKLAMQTADELKGITMPTAGISSLVTVDLEAAERYLEP